ncbi:hypothetical protein SeMB42_g07131 [Synchytrium endobioticum]|uniref:Uncharacterized protein n=1 Tax=Synchytrium endobioticum TaxID=286115 RepID=A0A507CW66_9FUNG|nr:hypothetical protein SeMB42_g07131 [Synchytrium endobioticum]TPX43359.1 hypothetical protein SeLEV6574_g05104 [Synchytrium endobioticum]TPX43368.1 hypothetical protein SeLEV6574_g05110 [Synchytrium endobioticum]
MQALFGTADNRLYWVTRPYQLQAPPCFSCLIHLKHILVAVADRTRICAHSGPYAPTSHLLRLDIWDLIKISANGMARRDRFIVKRSE